MLEQLKQVKDYNDMSGYSLSQLQEAADKQIDLSNGCILFLKGEKDYWLEFAMVEFSSTVGEIEVYLPIFWGGGTSSLHGNPKEQLRELRHMYFGDTGYVFYMPGESLIEAMNHLSVYFDMK